jgi:putative membrane protein
MPSRRLHPAGIGIYAVQAIGRALFPLLIIFGLSLLGQRGDGIDWTRTALYGLIGIGAATIAGYVRWSTTTYAVDERAIHHHTGVIRQEDTDVPLTRVEALDVQQGLLQRLLGVYAVHVQTGGGGGKGGEIELPALGAGAVLELRERVGAPAPAVDEGARLRLGFGSLLVAALTAAQLGIIVPVLAFGFQVAQQTFEEDQGRTAARVLPDTMGEWILAVGVLLGAAWALSVVGAGVAFAGFTVARDGDRLRIRRGLLSRREATIPVARVRAVRVVEGVLRRPFGLATLQMEVTGYAEEAAVARTLFPLLRTRSVFGALERLLPELADEPGGLSRPPARAWRRYLLVPSSAAVVVGALAAIWLSSPWPVAVLVFGVVYGQARWHAAGWRLSEGRLAIRSLRLARITVLAPSTNRESHELAQSVLQRRARLADLRVDFGKKTHARIRHLDQADATTAFEALASS